jgi:hypothetical protein
VEATQKELGQLKRELDEKAAEATKVTEKANTLDAEVLELRKVAAEATDKVNIMLKEKQLATAGDSTRGCGLQGQPRRCSGTF